VCVKWRMNWQGEEEGEEVQVADIEGGCLFERVLFRRRFRPLSLVLENICKLDEVGERGRDSTPHAFRSNWTARLGFGRW
jgi:hypothetical protein